MSNKMEKAIVLMVRTGLSQKEIAKEVGAVESTLCR